MDQLLLLGGRHRTGRGRTDRRHRWHGIAGTLFACFICPIIAAPSP